MLAGPFVQAIGGTPPSGPLSDQPTKDPFQVRSKCCQISQNRPGSEKLVWFSAVSESLCPRRRSPSTHASLSVRVGRLRPRIPFTPASARRWPVPRILPARKPRPQKWPEVGSRRFLGERGAWWWVVRLELECVQCGCCFLNLLMLGLLVNTC